MDTILIIIFLLSILPGLMRVDHHMKDRDMKHTINKMGANMKPYALSIAALVFSSSCFAVETNWVRIGQVKSYIVDVNKLSSVKKGGAVFAIARLLPRSSSQDTREMDPDAISHGPRPIFFKLTQANYDCATLEVSNYDETHFDANASYVGGEKGIGFTKVPDEYALILKYVCRK